MQKGMYIYEPKRLNVFSGILYKVCVWCIHFVYGTISNILPPSMTEKSNAVVEKLISDEDEDKLLTDSGIYLQIAKAVQYTIGFLDFVILASVTVILMIFSFFFIKYKMTD